MKTAASLLALTQEGFLDMTAPSVFKAKFFTLLAYNTLPYFLANKNLESTRKIQKDSEEHLKTEKEGICGRFRHEVEEQIPATPQ